MPIELIMSRSMTDVDTPNVRLFNAMSVSGYPSTDKVSTRKSVVKYGSTVWIRFLVSRSS